MAKAWGKNCDSSLKRHKRENVLGFMWHRCQRFESFVFAGSANSQVMIGCLEVIAQSLEKETWIVLDNSPIHRSEEFEEKIKEWAKLGLKIYFLPTYLSKFEQDRNVMAKDKI